MKCVYCGQENPEGNQYCGKCGTSLIDPDADLYGAQQPYASFPNFLGDSYTDMDELKFKLFGSIFLLLFVWQMIDGIFKLYSDLQLLITWIIMMSLVIILFLFYLKSGRQNALRRGPRIPLKPMNDRRP